MNRSDLKAFRKRGAKLETSPNPMITKYLLSLCVLALGLCSPIQSQPNIILIMVDDMGFSDLGSYGGEIETPNLDSLAASGLRFKNFRVTPMCVTSRISLLSGMDHHRAGRNNMPQGLSFAYLLRDAGYQTHWVGKNHGLEKLQIGNSAADFGFDNFYGLVGGETNNFQGDARWEENNQSLNYPANVPSGFYSTTNITDKAIEYIDQALAAGDPFFSFVAYNAPHGPLQAPKADIDKYLNANTYAVGWDVLREARYNKQLALGLIDSRYRLPEKGNEIPPWDDLPQTGANPWELNKDFEELTMATYAAMVDQIDQNVGRLVAHLQDPNGDLNTDDSVMDDTLILFFADNGGVYAGAFYNHQTEPWKFDDSGVNTGFGWGMLMNTPFRYYKHSSHEGGIRSPLIAHWPNGIKPGLQNSILSQALNIWDIYPTLIEIAGTAAYPASYDPDNNPLTANSLTPKSLQGESFAPIFNDPSYQLSSDTFIPTFIRSNGFYENAWKIVHYADGPWELYDLSEDPTEIFDLSNVFPEKRQELIDKWDLFRASSPLPASGWNTPAQANHRNWGFDEIHPGMLSTNPEYMAAGVPINTDLNFTIDGTVDFNDTSDRYIRLQRYGSSDILWQADPDQTHPSQGSSTITFTDLPELEPGSHYYITWDSGWFKYDGQNIARVYEAPFAYRFKTASTYEQTVIKNSRATPGSSALFSDDINGDSIPELANYLLATDTDNDETIFEVIFDETTAPTTPILRFQSPTNPGSARLHIEHSDDLAGGFTPIFEIDGNTTSIQNNSVFSLGQYAYGATTTYTVRLDTDEVDPSQNFFRARATPNSGEVPLAAWAFQKNSLDPIQLSPLVSASSATTMGNNSGLINSLNSLTLPHPLFAWSGSHLPENAIGVQMQTAVTARTPVEITKIIYTGYTWSTRSQGNAATTVSADIVAFLNGALDPTIPVRAARADISRVDGEDYLKTFRITYNLDSRILNIGDQWELRARLNDENTSNYSINQEGFGISSVVVYGVAQ